MLALALGLSLLPVLAGQAGADALAPSFDWSMPERFGPDRNGDGLADYVDGANDHTTGYDATPGLWRVDLDACASSPNSGVTFQWRLIDQPAATPIAVQGGPACDGSFLEVPEEGTYRLELRLEQSGVTSVPLVRQVVVQDWLIVALGDSYGSGEGAPDVPIDTSALAAADAAWQDVDVKLAELAAVEADTAGVLEAVGRWQAAADGAAANCHPTGNASLCAYYAGQVILESAYVVAELVELGWTAAVDTVEDAMAAVSSLVAAAEASWEAAVLVANSVTGALSARWQAERCHRSSNAGSAQAAKSLEELDARTSVTFIHLACSGATMAYGILGWYEGTEHPDGVTNELCNTASRPAGCIPPQLDVAKGLVGNREVDAVYVSIGGNDAHFADIVIACILQEPCSQPNVVSDPASFGRSLCPSYAGGPAFGSLVVAECDALFAGMPPLMDTAAQLIEEGINGDVRPPIDPRFPGLATGYGRLNAALVGPTGLVPASDGSRVFLSEYVDAVRDDNGNFCDSGTMGLDAIPGMSAVESQYVNDVISPALSGSIEAATVAHGWTFVDGIYDGFTNHGYCADDHYMVRLQETFLVEGRYHGMVHPNTAGYAVYAGQILGKWQSALYPSGSLSLPRRPDQAPFADAGVPWTVDEGGTVLLANDSWDGDGDPMTFTWSHDRAGAAEFDDAAEASPTLLGVDDAAGTITVAVSDEDGSRSDVAPFAVRNVAPAIDRIDGPLSPVRIGTVMSATAPFTDVGVNDAHAVVWDWGDGTSSPGVAVGGGGVGTATGTHTYAATGIYTVTATVIDDDGGRDQESLQYVVVYDPDGGFATGGGVIDSPPNAFTPGDTTDPDVVGQALFGFVSKYKPGAVAPAGSTMFRFHAAGLSFSSDAYEWLVISGTRAQYKGTGVVNGVGGFRFILTAVDGDGAATPGPDRFRIKIWNAATGAVVYDNQAGDPDDALARTAIGAGQITIQGSKRGS